MQDPPSSRVVAAASDRAAHSAYEGPQLVHSAHSLLSSYGILTILPTHASSLSLSFLFSLPFLSFSFLSPSFPLSLRTQGMVRNLGETRA